VVFFPFFINATREPEQYISRVTGILENEFLIILFFDSKGVI